MDKLESLDSMFDAEEKRRTEDARAFDASPEGQKYIQRRLAEYAQRQLEPDPPEFEEEEEEEDESDN